MSREDIAIILTFTIVIVLAVICGIGWHVINHIKSKRPHKSDDDEDNPITKFKDDLAEAYENHHNKVVRKLAQAVWNRVVQIEKWHDEEIRDRERREYSARWTVGELESKCEHYQSELDEWTKRCEELQSKLNESQERLKRESAKVKTLEGETDKLRDMLRKAAEAKAKTQPDYLIEKRFPGQINPFSRIVVSVEPSTATEATELAEHLQRIASQPLVSKEDVAEMLRDFGGHDADTNKWPEYMAKFEGIPWNFKGYKVVLCDMKSNETFETELYGTDIEDALACIDRTHFRVVGYEELP